VIKIPLTAIVLFMAFFGFSQGGKDTVHLKEDTTQILEKRSFEDNLADKYTGEEFNYNIKDGEAQNLLERFLNWFFQMLRDTFGINLPPGLMQVMEYIVYILMGALVIFLLVRFFSGENLSSIFTRKATSIIDINLSEEHIENVDLEALIKQALKQKDYRLAVRYHYLKALKTLSQKEIIDWHFEKTNWDYQREISIPLIKSIFKEVSYLYDYIWYGEQPIDEIKYEAVETRFSALEKQIPQ